MIKQAELELCYQQGVQAAFEKIAMSNKGKLGLGLGTLVAAGIPTSLALSGKDQTQPPAVGMGVGPLRSHAGPEDWVGGLDLPESPSTWAGEEVPFQMKGTEYSDPSVLEYQKALLGNIYGGGGTSSQAAQAAAALAAAGIGAHHGGYSGAAQGAAGAGIGGLLGGQAGDLVGRAIEAYQGDPRSVEDRALAQQIGAGVGALGGGVGAGLMA